MAEPRAEGGAGNEGNYGDSSGKLWTMYINQSETYDKTLSDSWKGDTDGIIVFTGLFSATVAAFLIESYKNLSSDSGDDTVALLKLLTNQIAALSNGTYLPVPQDVPPTFTPSASAIRVNALWFLSLIMSITCALMATLMQQWARHYLQVSQRNAAPHKRARIRAYLFEGVKTFHMAGAVEFIPTLLHASVFLFFAGLVDFMVSINKTVGYMILAFMALSASAYVFLTVLPIAYLNSPFRTPISRLLWPAAHVALLVALWVAHHTVEMLERLLETWVTRRYQLPSDPPDPEPPILRMPLDWMDTLSTTIVQCRGRFSSGMRVSVERGAAEVQWTVDVRALEWVLDILDEDREWEQFVDGIPGFARSEAVKDSKEILMRLMTPAPDRHDLPRLAVRISHLLETCYFGTGVLTEDARRRRMLACLTAIWHVMEAFNGPHAPPDAPLPDPVAELFGHSNVTRQLRADTDPRIAVVGRCMGALIARRLIRDIKTRDAQTPYSEADSQTLSELLDEPASDVFNYLNDKSATDPTTLANLVSILEGIIPSLTTDVLSADVLEIVQRTLTLLIDDLTTDHDTTKISRHGHAEITQRELTEDPAQEHYDMEVRRTFFNICQDIKERENRQGVHVNVDPQYALRFTRLAEFLHPVQDILEPVPVLPTTVATVPEHNTVSSVVSQFPGTRSGSIRSGLQRDSMLSTRRSIAGSIVHSSASPVVRPMSLVGGASTVPSRSSTMDSDRTLRDSGVVVE